MAFYKNFEGTGTAQFDFDPGDEWVEITEAEYDTFVASLPNETHDDVHAFLDGAGIMDAGARAAFHRLFGVEH